MKIYLEAVLVIEFEEHPVKDYEKGVVSLLDVTADGRNFSTDYLSPESFSMDHYCYCLIYKLIELPADKLAQFLVYQLIQVTDRRAWLRQFETFVELIYGLIALYASDAVGDQLKAIIRRHKYLPQLDTKSFLTATIKNYYHQHYDIDKVRAHLKELDDFEEGIEYLVNLKIDFIRSRPPFSIKGVEPFDKLLDMEIKKLEKLKKRSKRRLSSNDDAPLHTEKCLTSLTVPQLAYKYRVLYDLGLLPVRNKTSLFKAIAQAYSTANQKDISWKSFKNSFDSPDPKAIEFWVSTFQHLAVQAKKDKDG